MENTIAIPLVLRNDNYGFRLNDRINLFIEYYSKTPCELANRITLYVVDWNPPPDSTPLKDAFNWGLLPFKLIFYNVTSKKHLSIKNPPSRPIYDYLARNIVAHISCESHILVINQDILLPYSLLEDCLSLCPNSFLRADRIDFDWVNAPIFSSLETIRKNKYSPNDSYSIRQFTRLVSEDISYQYCFNDDGFYQHSCEIFDRDGLVFSPFTIYNTFAFYVNKALSILSRHLPLSSLFNFIARHIPFLSKYLPPSGFLHKLFPAHTNASGDFLCVSVQDFLSVGGYPFSPDWYMHVDGHLIYKLFAKGFSQIYKYNKPFLHLDHSRIERQNRPESLSYSRHMFLWDSYFFDKLAFKQDYLSWSKYVTLASKVN